MHFVAKRIAVVVSAASLLSIEAAVLAASLLGNDSSFSGQMNIGWAAFTLLSVLLLGAVLKRQLNPAEERRAEPDPVLTLAAWVTSIAWCAAYLVVYSD